MVPENETFPAIAGELPTTQLEFTHSSEVEIEAFDATTRLEKRSGEFPIFVKTVMGTTVAVNVCDGDTTKRVKRAIGVNEGISPAQIQLVWKGNVMVDEITVSEYMLKEEDTVILVLKKRETRPTAPVTSRLLRTKEQQRKNWKNLQVPGTQRYFTGTNNW